jgi:hypothetical protein
MKKRIRILIALCMALTMTMGLSQTANASIQIDFCATVSVVSYSNGGFSSDFTGHSFLIVKNTGNSEITVGRMSVPINGSVTLGTFGNRSSHSGIWYNIEGYYSSSLPSNRVSLTTALTGSQLVTMNSIINSNDSWAYLNNCSSFASKVWNSISNLTISPGAIPTPSNLCNSIKNYSYVTGITVPSKVISNIAYYNGTSIIYDSSGAYSN